MEIIIGIIVILMGLVFWGISIYHTLVIIRERIESSKIQVAAQIESRWDVARILIDLTKEYSEDKGRALKYKLDQISIVNKDSSVEQMERAEIEVEDILNEIEEISVKFDEFKTNKIYKDAINSINKCEENLMMGKSMYNDNVAKMNRKVDMIPANLVADILGLKERQYFKSTN